MSDREASARTIGIIAKPASLKLAQTLGLTAAAFFAGQTASATYTLLPAIMQSPPQLLARQFHAATSLESSMARKIQLPGTVILGLFFAWLAAREPAFTTRSFRAYATAAALCPASLAYVALAVKPTSDAIVSHAQSLQQPQPHQLAIEPQESASTILVSNDPTTTSSSAGSLFDGESPTTISPAASVRDATPSGASRTERLTFGEFLSQRRVDIQELNTHQLVDAWGWLNLGHAGLMAGAALAAAWAVASEDLSFFELF